jgi:hypothetical protein
MQCQWRWIEKSDEEAKKEQRNGLMEKEIPHLACGV